MPETREHQIKRLRMRSMRRGIKEMDLILIRFSDAQLEGMTDAQLDVYDAMLNENDHDLYGWITGFLVPKQQFAHLIEEIKIGLKS